MKVILSIKPEFANKIFNGEKEFEFRRVIFKNDSIKQVLVYATAPISKIIGEFEIGEILNETIDTLWIKTCHRAGITKVFYEGYFAGKEKGYAIKIRNPIMYANAICIKREYGLCPPQSFVYTRK